MFESYDELKKYVKENASKRGLERAKEEFDFFEKKHWQDFVLVLANIRHELRNCLYVPDGPAYESYILNLVSNPDKDCTWNLFSAEEHENYFFDRIAGYENLYKKPLSFTTHAVDPNEHRLRLMGVEISNAIENSIRRASLCYMEVELDKDEFSHGQELIIVSRKPVTSDIKKKILMELDKTNIGQDSILYEYLILHFTMHVGI